MNYRTAGQTALEGTDYNAASGMLTFNPGETRKTIQVTLRDDSRLEADESFALLLSDPVNASLGRNIGIATITDSLAASSTTTLAAGVEGLDLTGTGSINGTGNANANVLVGNGGNNILRGLGGNDFLAGGGGSDQFIFGSGRGFTTADFGLDTITDFGAGDKIGLSKASFALLRSNVGAGFSNASDFAAVTNDTLAATSQALIVYSRSTGTLFYNSNGQTAGFGTGGAFAQLSNRFNLLASDFLLQS
jgi:Ca2+-binding RTX toxin-like protein